MTQALPDLFGRASAVEADHARLRATWALLHDLSGSSETLGVPPGPEAWRLIEDFAGELAAHFAAEEADGYFGSLVEQQPHLRLRIERLRADHGQLSALVAELIEADRATLTAREFASRLGALLELLGRHERAEAGLLQEFFGRDEGTAD